MYVVGKYVMMRIIITERQNWDSTVNSKPYNVINWKNTKLNE